MRQEYKKLFEGVDIKTLTPEQMQNTKKLYNYIVESAEIAKKENVKLDDVLDEGIFSALLGGTAGATIGPAIGRALCKVLGVTENGVLGNLLTSRVVLAALGYELGYSM